MLHSVTYVAVGMRRCLVKFINYDRLRKQVRKRDGSGYAIKPTVTGFPTQSLNQWKGGSSPLHILKPRQFPALERNCKMTADSFASFGSEGCVRACVGNNAWEPGRFEAVEMLRRLITWCWISGETAERGKSW